MKYRGERPPVEPVAALEHSAAGAKAFAEFFIKTIDWGYATTSSTYMRHYFQRSCVECNNVQNALDRAHNKNERFVGDRFTLQRIAAPISIANGYSVVVTFDVSAERLVARGGGTTAGDATLMNYNEMLALTWLTGRWAVAGMVPQ